MTTLLELQRQLSEMILADEDIKMNLNPIISHAKLTIALKTTEKGNAPTGSFIGGRPVALPGFEWPIDVVGRPMLHLLQINLADVHQQLIAQDV